MYQAPTEIWNEIAKTQAVLHQPWKRLFSLPSESLLPELEKLEKSPRLAKHDARVVRAYLLTALLMENQAISTYLEAQQSTSLRSSLPELTSISEAVDLGTAEYRLSRPQQQSLRTLLSESYRN